MFVNNQKFENQPPERILDLNKPQLIYKIRVESSNNKNLLQVDIEKSDTEVSSNERHLELSSPPKLDKKNKNFNKAHDLLENKKNKNRQRKKIKTKIHIDEEEDTFRTSNSHILQTAGDLAISLMRPPKSKSQFTQAKVNTTRLRKQNLLSQVISPSQAKTSIPSPPKSIKINNPLTIQELSKMIRIQETEIIKYLFLKGISVTINQTIDASIIATVAENFGIEVVLYQEEVNAPYRTSITSSNISMRDSSYSTRPPIVTIMGHVDHGKTTLIDYIRKSNNANKEVGGITQTLAAYEVDYTNNNKKHKIVFLDTPGHEAFTSMRSRGANITDIAIIIIAADDGIKPQTVEAIRHIQKANVPCIVAISKIDKNLSTLENIEKDLVAHNIVSEKLGGPVPVIPISSITGQNIDDLLENIILLAELENLKADPTQPAEGIIIEAHLDKSHGPVATLLIQNGTLYLSDNMVIGTTYAKIRAIINNAQKKVNSAIPSSVVEIWGLSAVPATGEVAMVVAGDKNAKLQALKNTSNSSLIKQKHRALNNRITLDTPSAINPKKNKQITLVIKTDNQGSTEAILDSLSQIPQSKVQLNILSIYPGEITATDVELAYTTNAELIGFNTNFAPGARQAAVKFNITIEIYQVIYALIEDIVERLETLLDPEYSEILVGEAEVGTVFSLANRKIAGCRVTSNKLRKNSWIKVLRGEEVVYQGKIESLKRIREDVEEITAGNECGIFISEFQLWQIGDKIRSFDLIVKEKSLS
uniref:Translation initiation factor IF-2, chloroplastic n=1 Tax=Wildemania schizophylla TaxID=1134705 RepID=A0A126G1H3_WILSC|nr:translation initiation factor 2 [Wildemania schizophylla]AKS28400.1 translation initiation factor 2 [Wildemania schizophylla]